VGFVTAAAVVSCWQFSGYLGSSGRGRVCWRIRRCKQSAGIAAEIGDAGDSIYLCVVRNDSI
jgi:hypothetical protein